MKDRLASIADEFGTPCYVYDMDAVKRRADDIKKTFARHFKLSYAAKANPNTAVLRRIDGVAELLDISSGGELARALKAQWASEKISFTGPAKTDAELRAAVEAHIGFVVLESVNEAQRLSAIAAAAGVIQPVMLRIAPTKMPAGFGVTMSGRATPFGIDEEESEAALREILKLENVSVNGFHIYSGTQCLKAEAIAENHENCIAIFKHLSETFDITPEMLVFGGGIGIPYHEGDAPVDLASVAARLNPALSALRQAKRFSKTVFALELGRYLVGEAGFYLTRIINIKHSRGEAICLCDGGMNQHLAASGHLGSVIPRNYRMFKAGTENTTAEKNCPSYEVAGPLCTTIDRLGRKVKLPSLKIGDVIAIECSGAYGLTASPVHFISHELPKEILAETVGGKFSVEDISDETLLAADQSNHRKAVL